MCENYLVCIRYVVCEKKNWFAVWFLKLFLSKLTNLLYITSCY